MTSMRLVSTTLATWSPKVSSGMVTNSRRGLEEKELKRIKRGDLVEAKAAPEEFMEDAGKKINK
jgi:hypothetical protein